MVCICIAFGGICSIDLHTGEGRYRWRQFQSRHGNQNGGGCGHGMGDGVPDTCTERADADQQKKLDISHFVRSCNRSLLAVLLQGFTDG